ncbi:helix-turn-helix domain-containing protein [Gordonia hankookensis]|uniref:Helix-turn-helix domain-containing protein n=2 Tax=Gordonia hankookensis TaxID=589403 RepID=A0ABR7W6S6_9ACTN|nr:helix-turn-helix domain-containing protein [Gordonia hankookensis]
MELARKALTEQTTVSVPETALLLGISRATAYDLIQSGDLPVIRVGPRKLRVSTSRLQRILDGQEQPRGA